MSRLEPEWLVRWAALQPRRRALVSGSTDWTFAELEEVTRTLAGALIAAGIRAGGRIATLLADDAPSVALIHAARRVGAVLVPLNRRAAVPELRYQLAVAGVSVLVHDEAHLAIATSVARAADGDGSDITLSSIEQLLAVGPLPAGVARRLRDEVDLDAWATIIFTSGTTARPKAAVLSHGNHAASADAWATLLEPAATDRWLSCLPLFHIAGLAMVMRASRWGAALEVHDRFRVDAVADALKAEVSHVSLVPLMLDWLLAARPWRPVPPNLRAMLVGGGPLSAQLLGRALELGLPVMTTYGMTETASGLAAGGSPWPQGTPSDTFRPLAGAELRCAADSGEIEVRGPMVFRGYLGSNGGLGTHEPSLSGETSADGWFATGDLGVIGASGELRLLDRREDLLISGGENVYPAEVEAVLTSHVAISEAAVLGRPDDRWGTVPIAFIVLMPGATASDATLAAYCRDRLAAYKVPVAFHRREALPRNAAGKIVRSRLRESLSEETD